MVYEDDFVVCGQLEECGWREDWPEVLVFGDDVYGGGELSVGTFVVGGVGGVALVLEFLEHGGCFLLFAAKLCGCGVVWALCFVEGSPRSVPTLQAGIRGRCAIPGPDDPGYYVAPLQGLRGRESDIIGLICYALTGLAHTASLYLHALSLSQIASSL